MASEQQIVANRRNALQNTGPNTPEGKATVSRNRLIHGLTVKRCLLLEGEEVEMQAGQGNPSVLVRQTEPRPQGNGL